MSEIKREFRYYVIKRRDITADQEVALQDMLHDAKIPCQESVVVENDWPNYEHTWATIQRVSDGTYDDPYAENERLRARVAELEAAQQGSVPDGWKLVPVEPDEYMLNAGMSAFCTGGRVFQSMVEAAPQPPQEGK